MTNRYRKISMKKTIEGKKMILIWIIILVIMKRIKLQKLKLVRGLTLFPEKNYLNQDRKDLDRLLAIIQHKRNQVTRK
jgi:hypothetical protein